MSNNAMVIVGGTGSFGRGMARRILARGCSELRIVSRDEAKQHEMRIDLRSPDVRFYIGDVRDVSTLEEPFRGAVSVLHAAGLKQVPACESFPMQAVRT